MGKKPIIILLVVLTVFMGLFFVNVSYAVDPTPTPPYESCGGSGCPRPNITPSYECAASYEDWATKKDTNFWVKDEEVTALGKAGERSRQFLLWTLTHRSIDNHPTLMGVWSLSRNITYFLLVVVAAVMGLGIIVGKKYNFGTKIEVWPLVFKIAFAFLYATFSAAIVLLIIQLSDMLMLFFNETLGVDKLFNIFFLQNGVSESVIKNSEEAYRTFQGCRNLNVTLVDAVKTSKFLINITNLIYYFIGVMIVLRKIILWLLLFVSPFLAVLMPFVFIRNVGWIWIGVFFQWVFYGPLFALFLGGLAQIWGAASHIPFVFDFSRTNNYSGFIYPTTVNILYGGPAQTLSFVNSSNYVDTFAEYIISLLMLLAVVFFPWWLLRIFRDYCCDGISAMKNILMSMYDQIRSGQPPAIQPSAPSSLKSSVSLQVPQETTVRTRLETIEEIKRTKTEDISRSLNLSASKITDVARFETNHQLQESVKHNLDYLTNPTKAETPTERQKYMNIRTELFTRAVKEDRVAKQILSSISTSRVEQIQRREELIKTAPQAAPVTNVVSVKVNLPQQKVSSVNNSFISSISANNNFVNSVSQFSQAPPAQIQTILNSLKTNINQRPTKIVQSIAQQTGIAKERVVDVIKTVSSVMKNDKSVVEFISTNNNFINNLSQTTQLPADQIKQVVEVYKENLSQPQLSVVDLAAAKTGVNKEKVVEIINHVSDFIKMKNSLVKEVAKTEGLNVTDIERVVQTQMPLVSEPEKHIEQTVLIPPTVSIEDYEEVKKMWVKQYEKGEVPVTENISSRRQWVDQDIVFITNTLNKLLSPDEPIKQEGFDDLGYILPIFLINNLKGDELLVYLKAKLEAAKMVGEVLEKEKEITERLKAKSEEELVDVEKPKEKEAEKTMEMKKELPDL